MKAPLQLLILLALASISCEGAKGNSPTEAAKVQGEAAEKKGEWAEALKYYRQSAALTDKEKDPEAWATAQAHVVRMLCVFVDSGGAEPLAREILRLREKHYGPAHLKTASALVDLAKALICIQRSEEALPLMVRAHQIMEDRVGKDDPARVAELLLLAQLHRKHGQPAEAETLSRRVVGMVLKYQAEQGQEYPRALEIVREYIAIAREMKLTYKAIGERLQAEGLRAGLKEEDAKAIYKRSLLPEAAGANGE